MRRVVYPLVAFATAFGGLLVASPAVAAPAGLEVVAANSGVSSNDKSLTVTCPSGKVITGGGGYLTAPTDADGWVGLDRMTPTGSTFTATLREIGSVDYAGSWRMTTKAMCSPRPSGYQIISTTTETGSESEKAVVANCGGKKVIGLGGRINNGNGYAMLDDVYPSADLSGVIARGREVQEGYSRGWSVTAYAICADPVAGLERVTYETPYSSTAHKSVTYSCPGTKGLYSAGVAATSGLGVLLSGVNIWNTDKASVWADEEHVGYGGSWKLGIWLICAS